MGQFRGIVWLVYFLRKTKAVQIMSSKTWPDVLVRAARLEDCSVCGRICYDAFSAINATHGFPCDFPGPEASTGLLAMMFSSPGFYCVVAESDGRIVGSNVLDERSVIRGVGPITIDPGAQNLGIGRRLMQAVMDRARERGAAGVRLVQAAFHNRSLSLYSSLGFDLREPLTCMQGRTLERAIPGCMVRPARPADADACNALSGRVHGFDRGAELAQAIERGTARVVERGGRITGYTTNLAFFGHSTAETNVDLQALIASAESFGGPGILVPSRNNVLFRWCLSNGLRVVQPMTLMSTGLYNDPAGAWLPSVLF
ncbi:MAG TPA: GNAT family N-acetyltransferase [Granulicella sp.]|nr:GNAT family N-acetyltransferase [Granulicella sp.]